MITEEDHAQLILLIDKAKEIAGTDARLAALLGQHYQVVSNWRSGLKRPSIEDCALLASIAGLDPAAEMARAALRKHAGTKKGDLLMKALGKGSLAIGAAVASAGAHASAIFGTQPGSLAGVLAALATMCIGESRGKTPQQRLTRYCVC